MGSKYVPVRVSPNDAVEKIHTIAATKMAGIQYLKMWRASAVTDISQLALILARQSAFQLPIEAEFSITSCNRNQSPESSLKAREAFSADGACGSRRIDFSSSLRARPKSSNFLYAIPR